LSALAETYNFPPQRAIAAFYLEWCKAQSGDVDLERLRSAFNAVVALGPFTLLYTALLAEELLKAGQADDALSAIDSLVATLKSSFGFWLPEVHRVRGQCLAALGRPDEAADGFRRAARLAAEQGSELFALRAAVAGARLCSNDEDRASAMIAIEHSLAAMGRSDWPEIVAARETLAAGKDPAPLTPMSRQSAATSME
jgi:tetratricopeptide (TPR) repeat protein